MKQSRLTAPCVKSMHDEWQTSFKSALGCGAEYSSGWLFVRQKPLRLDTYSPFFAAVVLTQKLVKSTESSRAGSMLCTVSYLEDEYAEQSLEDPQNATNEVHNLQTRRMDQRSKMFTRLLQE